MCVYVFKALWKRLLFDEKKKCRCAQSQRMEIASTRLPLPQPSSLDLSSVSLASQALFPALTFPTAIIWVTATVFPLPFFPFPFSSHRQSLRAFRTRVRTGEMKRSPFQSCLTLGKLFDLPYFLVCKIRVVTVPSLWGWAVINRTICIALEHGLLHEHQWGHCQSDNLSLGWVTDLSEPS